MGLVLANEIGGGPGPWSDFTTWDLSPTDPTPPTKGAIVIDQIRFRQNGQMWEVEGQLEMSGAGVVGSGEYELLLPAPVEADTTKQPLGSLFGAIDSATPKGYVGDGWQSNAGSVAVFKAFLSSSTTLKFMILNTTSATVWSHTFGQFNQAFGFAFKAKFHGLGL